MMYFAYQLNIHDVFDLLADLCNVLPGQWDVNTYQAPSQLEIYAHPLKDHTFTITCVVGDSVTMLINNTYINGNDSINFMKWLDGEQPLCVGDTDLAAIMTSIRIVFHKCLRVG